MHFTPGKNIAMKVPPQHFNSVVNFYKNILRFEIIDHPDNSVYPSVGFKFGDKNLWIDKFDSISQTEVWFEVTTDNLERAIEYLTEENIPFRNEIEKLPENFKGFWISSPGDVIHLVTQKSK